MTKAEIFIAIDKYLDRTDLGFYLDNLPPKNYLKKYLFRVAKDEFFVKITSETSIFDKLSKK